MNDFLNENNNFHDDEYEESFAENQIEKEIYLILDRFLFLKTLENSSRRRARKVMLSLRQSSRKELHIL